MLPRSIPIPSYAATACIPCSVAARACPSSTCSPPRALHDAPFARPRLQWAVRLYAIRPRIIRLDAAGFRPAAYLLDPCHLACGGGHCLEPQEPEEPLVLAAHVEAREELGKRSSSERFFGRVFLFFH